MKIESPIYLSSCRTTIGQCYSAIIDGHVYRGCVGDELFPDIESTKNTTNPIKLCDDKAKCNQDEMVDTCIGCSGDECSLPTLEMERPCSFQQTYGKGCYLKQLSDKSYERGCMENLSEQDQIKCRRNGSKYCQSCPTRNCNRKIDFNQTCYYCDGSVDKYCYDPKTLNNSITCDVYSSTCLVGVDENGYAYRACSSNTDNDTLRFPNGFELCYDNLCNNQIFPTNWTRCFRCANDRSCDHPSADLLPQLCQIHGDTCFIYGIEGMIFFLQFYLIVCKLGQKKHSTKSFIVSLKFY